MSQTCPNSSQDIPYHRVGFAFLGLSINPSQKYRHLVTVRLVSTCSTNLNGTYKAITYHSCRPTTIICPSFRHFCSVESQITCLNFSFWRLMHFGSSAVSAKTRNLQHSQKSLYFDQTKSKQSIEVCDILGFSLVTVAR